jgi:glyoxylase I family protein
MNAFNHVAFQCWDLAAQEAFYTKHFGFKRSRTLHRGTPEEFFLMKLGNMRLELFPSDRNKTAGLQGGEQPIGFKHLAFDVPKLEPVLDALRADGIEPDPIIDCSHIAPGARIVFFRDPEGNIIELMEGYTDEE